MYWGAAITLTTLRQHDNVNLLIACFYRAASSVLFFSRITPNASMFCLLKSLSAIVDFSWKRMSFYMLCCFLFCIFKLNPPRYASCALVCGNILGKVDCLDHGGAAPIRSGAIAPNWRGLCATFVTTRLKEGLLIYRKQVDITTVITTHLIKPRTGVQGQRPLAGVEGRSPLPTPAWPGAAAGCRPLRAGRRRWRGRRRWAGPGCARCWRPRPGR